MNQIVLKLRRKSQNVYLLLLSYCFLHNFQCCSKCHRIYPHFQNKFLCLNVKNVRCPKMSISLILRKIKIILDSNKEVLPYILESNPHPFYSFRGLKNQKRITIACGLDSRSRAGFWKNDRAAVRAVRTI